MIYFKKLFLVFFCFGFFAAGQVQCMKELTPEEDYKMQQECFSYLMKAKLQQEYPNGFGGLKYPVVKLTKEEAKLIPKTEDHKRAKKEMEDMLAFLEKNPRKKEKWRKQGLLHCDLFNCKVQ